MNTMNKVLAGHKYVANFLDMPVKIGMIYRMDDEQFIPAVSFNDMYSSVDLTKLTDSGSKGMIKFSDAKTVSISFGAGASSTAGKSQVKIGFRRARSVAGVLQDAAIDSLRYGNIVDKLKLIWIDKGYDKFLRDYVFIYEVVTAASGTLIYSEDSKNEIVLEHKLGTPVTKIADLGSGNFEFVSNTKRTLELIRNVAHKPLFKAFMFRKNWQPEILG